MKRFLVFLIVTTMAMAAQAQYYRSGRSTTPFSEGKYYIGASLSGLDLSYNGSEKFAAKGSAQVGYLALDNLMITAEAGLDCSDDKCHALYAGAGGRYYIEQNGLFLGAKVNYVHGYKSYNDVMPGVEVGYAFFLSRTVTVEPSIYYNQSFKEHSDYSKIGLKIGIGVYL
jgi:hypothetical protein